MDQSNYVTTDRFDYYFLLQFRVGIGKITNEQIIANTLDVIVTLRTHAA